MFRYTVCLLAATASAVKINAAFEDGPDSHDEFTKPDVVKNEMRSYGWDALADKLSDEFFDSEGVNAWGIEHIFIDRAHEDNRGYAILALINDVLK